jgi:hypothetical protein
MLHIQKEDEGRGTRCTRCNMISAGIKERRRNSIKNTGQSGASSSKQQHQCQCCDSEIYVPCFLMFGWWLPIKSQDMNRKAAEINFR